MTKNLTSGFVDAVDFGFSPTASGIENASALQKALDNTGTIVVSQPGTYKIADTVYIGSNTSLVFGNNKIQINCNNALPDHLKSQINIYGCIFNHSGNFVLLKNNAPNKKSMLKTSANIASNDAFAAETIPSNGKITVKSDLPGLN